MAKSSPLPDAVVAQAVVEHESRFRSDARFDPSKQAEDCMYQESFSEFVTQDKPRFPLVWEEVHTHVEGRVRASIQSAKTARGSRIYSFSLGRIREDATVAKFFNPDDADSIARALVTVTAWIEAERKRETRRG